MSYTFYGDEADYWAVTGLLHDIDFELYPEEHCQKAPELLREAGVGEDMIHSICSHGYGICSDVKPEHEMEKVLFAADELTGLIGAAALMRPSKSVMDMEVSSVKKKFKVENPELWWPNGYGEQPLYRMRVELISEGRVLDIWEKRIGLRTMTMRREKDEWGESFAHEINGVCIFAMGADYIPEDHLIGRTSPEKTRRLLEDSCAANFNYADGTNIIHRICLNMNSGASASLKVGPQQSRQLTAI